MPPLLDKDDGLIIRDFESAPAAWVRADQEIVCPHEIVTRLRKLRTVYIISPYRDILFLYASEPANLELG